MADSPGSPLSSLASDEFAEDMKFEDHHSPTVSSSQMPPSKRRRTGIASWDRHTPISSIHEDIPPASPTASISSDTSGELPNSPFTLSLIGGGVEDDYSGQGRDQVTVCQWEGCNANDLGNMDALVKHIHDDHIGSRQKKYLCEWSDCARKGQTHASGYALRAHMRSHTKEKPFYCTLPECDRSFTRSDALTKHMRTVHETDVLRPTDATSKGGASATTTGNAKPTRIKLKLSQPAKEGSHDGDKNDITKESDPSTIPYLGPELGFDDHELSLSPEQLCHLLCRQIHWAEQEAAQLKRDWDIIEPIRKESWRDKELIFEDVIHAELRVFRSAISAEDLAIAPGKNGAMPLNEASLSVIASKGTEVSRSNGPPDSIRPDTKNSQETGPVEA
ncbi:hypothetical protein PABG_03326 [Paracoccidioides brasiliensis Pb03]|uniref:C2H2-type domain-containing protein n=2 Tax=Paracoccidioides brasiliensis TaxID=121759 RepID=C1G4M3_PARBD|nr:uncharacterized protein PADG_01889 [Paracoccidioides brasiliensis Pb18]EEH21095.1 hypothetical protein PABG_03326 [Paracoccidioides brasiliensis Pb03]EEH45739.1 hypothetical protein PADG_01889 [Paracoccidioides brasiliensis Pb18]ODH44690.1 hypothetical protein ACO22_00847 [Paracoccidioides brasiliensis]ODH50847.1 hypothetical protein GX48_02989 [Paracoccidioides brasiliensis]